MIRAERPARKAENQETVVVSQNPRKENFMRRKAQTTRWKASKQTLVKRFIGFRTVTSNSSKNQVGTQRAMRKRTLHCRLFFLDP